MCWLALVTFVQCRDHGELREAKAELRALRRILKEDSAADADAASERRRGFRLAK